MAIIITKKGSFVKVQVPGREPESMHKQTISLQYNNNNNTVTVICKEFFATAPVNECTFEGVALANEADFDAQVEILFPNEGSGSGGTTTLTEKCIKVTSADFVNDTDVINPLFVGKILWVFWNNIPKYLDQDIHFETTATGLKILVPGFVGGYEVADPLVNQHTFYVTIIN